MPLTISGNDVMVLLDNVVEVDLVQTIRGTEGFGHEPASGIGDIKVREYVPSIARYTVTFSRMVLTAEKLLGLGLVPETARDAMKGRRFTIAVYFKPAGPLIRKWIDAVYDGGDMNVTAHRISITDATFLATDAGGLLSGVA